MNHPDLWENPLFKKDYVKFKDGKILDPCDTLPGDVRELEEDFTVVRDGTGAMSAYHDMVFGEHINKPAERDAWKDKLLRYCKLDTMSMVIVWKHWVKLSSPN